MEKGSASSERARKGSASARSRRAVASTSASAAASGQESAPRDRHRAGPSAALAERKSNVAVGAESRKAGVQRAEQPSGARSDHAVSQPAQKNPKMNKRKRQSSKEASKEASPSREDKLAKTSKGWHAYEKAMKHDLNAAKVGDKAQIDLSAKAKASSLSLSAPAARLNDAEEQLGVNMLRAQLLQVQAEKDQLQAHLDKSEEMATKQKAVLSHIHAQCSCTICFELAWRPHVLSPCGHIFCARCLLMWFKRPLPNEADIPVLVTGELRVAEENRRTLNRQKVCPHCREKVTGTPAEVWMVKGLIESVDGSARVGQVDEPSETKEEQKESRGENLPIGNEMWKGIFRERQNVDGPLYDDMDDVYRCMDCHSEVVDGLCTNPYCQRLYDVPEDGHQHAHFDDDEEAEQLFQLFQDGHYAEEDDEEWDSEDDSFIDDGPIVQELESDEDDLMGVPEPPRRRHVRNVAESDDDEVLEVDGQGRAVARPPRRRRIVASLSDSDDSDIAVLDVRPHSPRMENFSDFSDEEGGDDRSEDSASSEETLSEVEYSDESSDDDDM